MSFPTQTSTSFSSVDTNFNNQQDEFTSEYNKTKSTISTAQKVGIGIGVAVAVLVIAFLITILIIALRRRKIRRRQMAEYSKGSENGVGGYHPQTYQPVDNPQIGVPQPYMGKDYGNGGPVEIQQTGKVVESRRELGGGEVREMGGESVKMELDPSREVKKPAEMP